MAKVKLYRVSAVLEQKTNYFASGVSQGFVTSSDQLLTLQLLSTRSQAHTTRDTEEVPAVAYRAEGHSSTSLAYPLGRCLRHYEPPARRVLHQPYIFRR